MDVGGLWGAGKGLLCGATLGIGKGVVVGVDKAYESAAPVVLSSSSTFASCSLFLVGNCRVHGCGW